MVSVACLALLALLTWQVAVTGPLVLIDERLGDAMRTATPPAAPPEGLAELFADLGNMAVALPALAVAAVWSLLRTRRWLQPLCCLLVTAAVPLAISLLKAWLDRPGPVDGSGYYPSGHAATAAIAFGGAALLLSPSCCRLRRRPRSRPGRGQQRGKQSRQERESAQEPEKAAWRCPRVALPGAAVLLTAVNGVGLVWRGYHWPADVLASWCLSWLLLVTATTVSRRALRRPGRRRSADRGHA